LRLTNTANGSIVLAVLAAKLGTGPFLKNVVEETFSDKRVNNIDASFYGFAGQLS